MNAATTTILVATTTVAGPPALDGAWAWPVDLEAYDRTAELTPTEREALAALATRRGRHGHWSTRTVRALARLRTPILDVLTITGASENARCGAQAVLVAEMHRRQRAFWAWTADEWGDVLCASGRQFTGRYPVPQHCRAHLMALGYLVGPPLDLNALGPFNRLALARKVFGQPRIDGAIQRVATTLVGWGYREEHAHRTLHAPVCEALLANRSPRLEDLTADHLDALRWRAERKHLRDQLYVLSRALFGLGLTDRPPTKAFRTGPERDPTVGVAPAWVAWSQRWLETSTLAPRSRRAHYILLLKAGRWAAHVADVTHEHPAAAEPAQWTRQTAAAYVAAVDRMTVGQWASSRLLGAHRVGKPLTAKSKTHHLAALSAFFRDAHEWGWLPRRFDPRRCFAVPRAMRALLGPNPRVLADDVWAKLLWAGLNLAEADLSHAHGSSVHFYPLSMVRALAVVWLFTGLRSDEIHRLRVGCVRWQREDVHIPAASPETGETQGNGAVAAADSILPPLTLPKDAVCLLDVPTHKTGVAFTKPVDCAVGEAVAVWEQARPVQPAFIDPKTAEVVQVLFAYRGARLGENYLNDRLIPLLCRKAGIPAHDARGDITSHRARSTIASQLFNAREPMSLFELQTWLGHRWATSTQHYVKIAPTRLAKAYADAGYFERNLRTIDVLVDQEAVTNGAAAEGEPWKFYDLGHGYCTYDFFDQCPHRMACAKCSFYRPKGSTQTQLLEGKANLLRLRQDMPLLEEERAAVEDGIEALEHLLATLADTPTPDGGLTPRQRGRWELPMLPAVPPMPLDLPTTNAHPLETIGKDDA